MKKSLFIVHCTLFIAPVAQAACPSGSSPQVRSDWMLVENGAACPSGYTTVLIPSVIPNLAGTTGGDTKGTFTYGACSHNP